MAETPPIFQESSRCDVCHCSFTTFRRRHHCRCCGRTLCHEHSSNYMALPQFGIYSDVRVCSDCFNKPSWSEKDDKQTSVDASTAAADALSRLEVTEDAVSVTKTNSVDNKAVPECKCGMPLCVCVVPTPEPASLQKMQNSTISNAPLKPRPKKAISSQQAVVPSSQKTASSSTSKPSSFVNFGQARNGSSDKDQANYDASGEGLREAIKNGDAIAVKELLTEGVDANYCDKQGFTLLHLAALFNQTEIAFILINHGASMESKNAQGETPVDCAPTMLQFKMRKKMDELSGSAMDGGK